MIGPVADAPEGPFTASPTPPAPGAGTGERVRRWLTGVPEGGRPTYWLTRFLILRLLGLVYAVAFLILVNQALPLIGHHGLLPADAFLARVAEHFGSRREGFLELPSLFWAGISDRAMVGLAWTGLGLSILVLLGFANAILLLVLWALYFSFVKIGQDWYGYGWEIQLLETGFLAIFLCPLLDPRPFPRRAAPPAVIGLFRWLIFRIMIGAGLIKLRGDPCWRDLTCLDYHYETQPIPNPVSRLLHFMPRWFQRTGVLYNHLTEVVSPWFAFGPTLLRRVAGAIMLWFQIFLIGSGNLSFLNWLTIVPILACFDDGILRRVLPRSLRAAADRAAAGARPSRLQPLAVGALLAVVSVLSIEPVLNLMSGGQLMNASFNRLELVNTYGAFGSVGRQRREIVFEGTDDAALTDRTAWREYEFKCKPGDPYRRPCVISPYQERLDWQIWFAAMSTPERYPWSIHLVWKLLHDDRGALSLLANDPFPGRPPRYVRALLYRYRFAPLGDPSGAWWTRELLGVWIPPLAADDPRLRRFLAAYGWIDAAPANGPSS
jgi:hypothetical protein